VDVESREQLARNSATLRNADQAVAARNDARDHPKRRPPGGNSRLLVATTLAVALVVGAVAALALDSWLVLVLALVLHGVATVVVLGVTASLLSREDKPAPTEVVRREARGESTDLEAEGR